MERLVDVLDSSGAAIHTYTITLGRPGVVLDDAAYEAKAREAAAQGWLIGDAEPGNLSAKIHIGRGGQMVPMTWRAVWKRNRASSRPLSNAPTFYGSRTGAPWGARAGAASAGSGLCALGAGWTS